MARRTRPSNHRDGADPGRSSCVDQPATLELLLDSLRLIGTDEVIVNHVRGRMESGWTAAWMWHMLANPQWIVWLLVRLGYTEPVHRLLSRFVTFDHQLWTAWKAITRGSLQPSQLHLRHPTRLANTAADVTLIIERKDELVRQLKEILPWQELETAIIAEAKLAQRDLKPDRG